jgi:hypothetical protein
VSLRACCHDDRGDVSNQPVEHPVIVERFGSLDSNEEHDGNTSAWPRMFKFNHPNPNWNDASQPKAFWESMRRSWKA